MKSILFPLGSVALLALAGCASTAPTSELVDARRAYDEARASEAATYSPEKVLSAKQALDRAEAAHSDDPGSFEEKSLAYVAQRRAALAKVYGLYSKDRKDAEEAKNNYRLKQDQLRKNAEQKADSANEGLTSARRDLATQQTELQSERAARLKAEQSAAAAMASLAKIAQVKEESRGTVITLDGAVLFVTGKSELLPIARDKLNEVAKALKEVDDSQSVEIQGYTDSRGADDMNLKLSQARADSVRDYLASQGVKGDKLRAVGKGEANPVASNDSPEGRANNRRVEIVIGKRSGSSSSSPDTTK